MTKPKKLLAILAHPDDETLGVGGALALYADKGVETHLICATRGQRGWFGAEEDNPGEETLGKIREKELYEATDVLKIKSVKLLDYMDGELDKVDPACIIPEIASYIQEIQPDVILTFDPYGVYGHPDHIAISQFTTAAIVQAAIGVPDSPCEPHGVEALYYYAMTAGEASSYQAAFGDLVMHIDGVERRTMPWLDWSISVRMDTSDYVPQIWEAVRCHRSQLPGYNRLLELPDEQQRAIFGLQTFYRAYSMQTATREQVNSLPELQNEP